MYEICCWLLDELSVSVNECEKIVIGLWMELMNKIVMIGDMRVRLDRFIASEIDFARKLSEL